MARPDIADSVYDTFINMANGRLNADLRVKEMMHIVNVNVTSNIVPLPAQWLEIDYVRFSSEKPLIYKDKPNFLELGETNTENKGKYCIVGNNIIIGGVSTDIVGKSLEISYYKNIPLMNDTTSNWVFDNWLSMYTSAALVHGFAYTFETDRAMVAENNTASYISKLNNAHMVSSRSGSKLRSRARGFG